MEEEEEVVDQATPQSVLLPHLEEDSLASSMDLRILSEGLQLGEDPLVDMVEEEEEVAVRLTTVTGAMEGAAVMEEEEQEAEVLEDSI